LDLWFWRGRDLQFRRGFFPRWDFVSHHYLVGTR